MTFLIILLISSLLLGCHSEERVLPHGPDIVSSLNKLKAEKKFVEDMSLFYPGAPDESMRRKAENIVNEALSELIIYSDTGIPEEKFWMVLESAVRRLAAMDSEETDRGLSYMEEIMDVYGIKSSDGRLNEWRYGFN